MKINAEKVFILKPICNLNKKRKKTLSKPGTEGYFLFDKWHLQTKHQQQTYVTVKY